MERYIKRVTLVIICIAAVIASSMPVFADVPHEDPESATAVFDGISVFNYYTETFDAVLVKDSETARLKMSKMPFANIPENLQNATDELASSIVTESQMIVEISDNIETLISLSRQSRFPEADFLLKETEQTIDQAEAILDQIELLVVITGSYFSVATISPNSDLRIAYDNVLDRIARLRGLLDTYRNILESSITSIISSHALKTTALSLNVEPLSAFVGDNVNIAGTLTSEGQPLANREIHLLFNNSIYATVETDVGGHYETNLAVPFWYEPEIQAQALYYPVGGDIGIYLASTSPEITLEVLFYETELTIALAPKAYPGLETTIFCKFTYGELIPPTPRPIEIYLDNNLIAEGTAIEEFTATIKLDDDFPLGTHAITASSTSMGRYAPATATVGLNVTRAIPVLTVDFPTIVLIPGKVDLSGQLQSGAGSLSNADITITLDRTRTTVKSSESGAFEASLEMKWGFELVGSQDLIIQVTPQEPWNDSLVVSKKAFLISTINCAVFLAIVIFFGVFLSYKLKRRIEAYARRRTKPAVAPASRPETTPVYSETINVPLKLVEATAESEPRQKIFAWYISILKLVQKAARAFLRPNQTLREFAADTQKTLGPVSAYFIDFTKMIEKLLYSSSQTTDKEVSKSRELTDKIQEGLER